MHNSFLEVDAKLTVTAVTRVRTFLLSRAKYSGRKWTPEKAFIEYTNKKIRIILQKYNRVCGLGWNRKIIWFLEIHANHLV